MQVKITIRGKQGAGKTRLHRAIAAAIESSPGIDLLQALIPEPENVKGKRGQPRERVVFKAKLRDYDAPPAAD